MLSDPSRRDEKENRTRQASVSRPEAIISWTYWDQVTILYPGKCVSAPILPALDKRVCVCVCVLIWTHSWYYGRCVFYSLSFKGIVHPKMKLCWKCPHSQAIQDVDEFVSSSDLEKCSITSVARQWILRSEWVPSELESKQLIKTSQ